MHINGGREEGKEENTAHIIVWTLSINSMGNISQICTWARKVKMISLIMAKPCELSEDDYCKINFFWKTYFK